MRKNQQRFFAMTVELPPLPVDCSDFVALRRAGMPYVDKTALVCELARHPWNFLLLRPRGFGKSLLVSTLESLFRDGLEHFRGLAAEKLWTDKTCRVVRLDFAELSDFSDAEEFRARFEQRLADLCGEVGFRSPERFSLLGEFALWLDSQEPLSLVLLIDNYDAPLLRCLDRPDVFDGVRRVMSQFFAVLKSRGGGLRFLLLTGIFNFTHTRFFPSLNYLLDISYDSCYAHLTSFTDEELEENFGPYLDRATETRGITRGELAAMLRAHCGGYSFDAVKDSPRVHCPRSALQFLAQSDTTLQGTPFECGVPASAYRDLESWFPSSPLDRDETMLYPRLPLDAPWEGEEAEGISLLVRSGCLTIQSPAEGFVQLGFPNENAAAFTRKLLVEEAARRREDSGVPKSEGK